VSVVRTDTVRINFSSHGSCTEKRSNFWLRATNRKQRCTQVSTAQCLHVDRGNNEYSSVHSFAPVQEKKRFELDM